MIVMRLGRTFVISGITWNQLNLIEAGSPNVFAKIDHMGFDDFETEAHLRQELVKINQDKFPGPVKPGSITIYGPVNPELYEELYTKPNRALLSVLKWGWTFVKPL